MRLFSRLEHYSLDRRQTVDVKSLPYNAWGLYEMHGNVYEWCQDVWQEKLSANLQKDLVSLASDEKSHCVVRGGAWRDYGRFIRSAHRHHNAPNVQFNTDIGFRLAR